MHRGTRRGAGAPLRSLAAWCLRQHEFESKAQHMQAQVTWAQRKEARATLMMQDNYDGFKVLEANHSDSEPEVVPALYVLGAAGYHLLT